MEINIKGINHLEKPRVFWGFMAFLTVFLTITVLKYSVHWAEEGGTSVPSSIQQKTEGDQSPIINAVGNVNITYGTTEEKLLNELLEKKEREIRRLLLDQNKSQEERKVLEQELKEVEEKKNNIDKALEEEAKRRHTAEQALGQLKDQLPAQQIKEAQKSLKEGDTQKAEAVFDAVLKKGSGNMALAAFNSGQLAEGRIDFTKAMKQYTLAVTLDQNNPDYLVVPAKFNFFHNFVR